MSEKYVITFTRNKKEASKIYFGRVFRKQILFSVIILIFIIPASFMLSIVFAVITEQVLKLGEKGTNWLMALWTIMIVYPFLSPVIKQYFA